MSLSNSDRKKVISRISNILLNIGSDLDFINHLSIEIEDLVFKIIIQQCEEDNRKDLLIKRYSTYIGNIMTNLDPLSSANEGNQSIAYSLIKGDITPDIIVYMTPFELNPKRSEYEYNKIQARLNSKIEKKYIKNMKCKYCDAYKITCSEIQTRSLDEPKTIFYECDQCNRRW